MKYGLPGRALGAALFVYAVLGAAIPHPVHAAPAIGAPTGATGGVGRYKVLELTFPVTTVAASPLLPYDPSTPSYAANLRPSEDARNGVAVDALLLPPGQTDWSRALTWPCYWQQDFDAAGNPTGSAEWHLRYAPTQVGTWQYELRATDASGNVTTPPASFTCVSSASKGFVHISPTDSRYFEYSDGTPFIAMGSNTEPQDLGAGYMQAVHTGGGTWLGRVWTPTQGIGVFGGVTQNAAFHSVGLYSGSITAEDAHSGRYCLSIPVPSGFGPQIVINNAPANTMLTLTACIKGVGESGPSALWTSVGVAANVSAPDAHGWHQVSVSFGSGAGGRLQIGLGDYGSTSGHLLVDDVTLTNPAGGDLLGTAGGFEGQTAYDQAAAARLDGIVQAAQAENCFVKLVCVNKFDQSLAAIKSDGTTNIGAFGSGSLQEAELSLGGTTDPNADTPVQRFQRFYARYFVARWGAFTSVHSLEYVNEMDYNNGIEYAGAQAFARTVHAYLRDGTTQGRIPVTSSTAANGGGLTYDTGFYENEAQYPDIDYADYHLYPDYADASHGNGLPYDDVGWLYNCRGSQRYTSGGPNGLGRLRFTPATQVLGDPNNLQALWPLPTLRGQGRWTLSYWLRADAGAQFSATPNAQIHLSAIAGGYMQSSGGGVSSAGVTWQKYSNTFTLNDDSAHQGGWLNLYACLAQSTPVGTGVEFGDVRLTAPDGQVFYRLAFNEPNMALDSASEATYLAGGKASYSGDPAIGKPFMVGESEPLNIGNTLGQDTAGVFARQAVWAGALSPFAQITQFWHEADVAITASNGWRFEGGVERFLAGVPLSNGRYRDLGAVSSPTLRVVGQKDVQAGNAVFWVQNNGTAGDGSDAANWYNLTTNPALVQPVSGTITIPGLPDGSYEADIWDTSSGQFVNALTLSTSGGTLSVPLSGLAADEAVKVFPATSARMVLHLTADQTVVSHGGRITFTLTYANQGTTSALGVNLPWPVPDHTQFVSAGNGGTYDATQDAVTWRIGTVPAGASGSVTLTVAAK